jgi:ABC-2 type transport system ATP-binding protein
VDEPNRAYAVLRDAGYDVYGLTDGRLQVGTTGRRVDDPATITRLLGEHGLWLRELRLEATDLESAFLEITGEDGPGDVGSPQSLTGRPTGGPA